MQVAGTAMPAWGSLGRHGVLHSRAIQTSALALRPKGTNGRINKWPASNVSDGMPGLLWWHQACLGTQGPGLRNSNLRSLSPQQLKTNKSTYQPNCTQCFIPPCISRAVKTLTLLFWAWYALRFLHSPLQFLHSTDTTLNGDKHAFITHF